MAKLREMGGQVEGWLARQRDRLLSWFRARLLREQPAWFESRHPSTIIKMGDISKGVAKTVQPAKK